MNTRYRAHSRIKNRKKIVTPPVISKKNGHFLFFIILVLGGGWCSVFYNRALASKNSKEIVEACVILNEDTLTPAQRTTIAQCLGWQPLPSAYSFCPGSYYSAPIEPLTGEEIHLEADKVSFYNEGQSTVSGNVMVQQTNRIVTADTAYIFRNAKSNQVSRIELLGEVHYTEPDRLLIAKKVTLYPIDKSGTAENVIYRFNTNHSMTVLPAWGQARFIKRFANKDSWLEKATYTTCPPEDKAWHIQADSIALDNAKATGVARHAKLFIGDYPLLYTPYLSFPTSRERKSGFLIPVVGTSNVGGFDLALPYYWNIAPNYDATITPHLYTRRGLMVGSQFRYLTETSVGEANARILPHDRAYSEFLNNNQLQYPQLRDDSTDRWALQWHNLTNFTPDLRLQVNFQQVSDDYYLQDFNSNLALLTERQLVREGALIYTTDNWYLRSMVQSYQTLQPINQTPVQDVYQRLPQLFALGSYNDLPYKTNLSLTGQFDYFDWPNDLLTMPEGSRYYFNPVLSRPFVKPWGYVTPAIEAVQNYYQVNNYSHFSNFERTIPRYSVDSGLFFERDVSLFHEGFIQTLEPRLYYLNVPFHNQTQIPVYDSAYMIFNLDQLFRTNRFSGFDRIGDTNQLSYAVTTRWMSEKTGAEKASFGIGQIQYFADRHVQLCQSLTGSCVDKPYVLGYLSPLTRSSPIASRMLYHFNPQWLATGDYVWNGNTHATNNANLDLHYQPAFNQLVGLAYTYMVSGDITQVATTLPDVDPLHQVTFSYAWPFSDRWSTLGAYGYNISKNYEMMSLFGVQYDSCCWAVRLIGGRSFTSLNPQAQPQYNNNVYLQVQLKGLGSAATSDPSSTIRTYLPGYVDSFHH